MLVSSVLCGLKQALERSQKTQCAAEESRSSVTGTVTFIWHCHV